MQASRDWTRIKPDPPGRARRRLRRRTRLCLTSPEPGYRVRVRVISWPPGARLQRHDALHLHALHAAVLVQRHQQLLLDHDRHWLARHLLRDAGRRRARGARRRRRGIRLRGRPGGRSGALQHQYAEHFLTIQHSFYFIYLGARAAPRRPRPPRAASPESRWLSWPCPAACPSWVARPPPWPRRTSRAPACAPRRARVLPDMFCAAGGHACRRWAVAVP